jgi:hypothetical protein
MSTTDTPEPKPESNLPALRTEAGALGPALPPEEINAPITAAQAKVDAIAQVTMSAYARAATLQLGADESAALQEPFPDEAFQPGAAGKENLIYVEHAFLRDRLNKVLGIGQWAIIPRNRWAEPFKFYSKFDKCQKEGTRIYVEAMLMVRGAFVAEAVGSMDYYPNDATNYGDAVEGAKTAALRRTCKEFGVGLQAWSKDWCEGWWQRRRQGARGQPPAQAARPAPTQATPAPRPAPAWAPPTPETPERKLARWVALMREAATNRDEYAEEVLRDHDILMPNETLADYPLRKLPASRGIAAGLLDEIRAKSGAGEPPPPAKPAAKPAPAPAPAATEKAEEPWRAYPMPFGKNAGTPLGKLAKPYLFGLWANYVVETEWKGKPRSEAQITKDLGFRTMLDDAGRHYEFTKPEDSQPAQPSEPEPGPGPEPDDADDCPF